MEDIVSQFEYKYPIIDVPASGIRRWIGGAYTLCFVYSKYQGNFILRGYRKEVEEYLKANYTHYFYNVSMWNYGNSRNHWYFWKNTVSIYEPTRTKTRSFSKWKYTIIGYNSTSWSHREITDKLFFKRLPKRWIKEFDKL